jgi:uncharacterized protein YggU (UPF0235/DUF167 family)
MHDGILQIRMAAPAVENAAILALVEFVAKRVGVAKRSVRIVSGQASRRKALEITDLTLEAITQGLQV